MKLQDFEYRLPRELIAQYPLKEREKARLMIVDRKMQTIQHDIFGNITKYIPAESVLILNDSRVIPARLFGKRETGGRVEIFLLKRLADGYSYETLIRPLKRLNTDEKIYFDNNGLYAQLKNPLNRIVRFNAKNISSYLNRFGHMPLPPYIKRVDEPLDKEFYQTVYAKNPGSVASPTAGLHFTNSLLTQLKKKGHAIEKLTLHVNYATFNPVKEEDITKHRMHTEQYGVSKKTWDSIQKYKKQGRKIVAVGTTACRVLETVGNRHACSLRGETNIFIYPGFIFQMTDALITNFHLPKSTLLMLVYAFASSDLMKRAYKEAIQEKYRFYSYGDGMLII